LTINVSQLAINGHLDWLSVSEAVNLTRVDFWNAAV